MISIILAVAENNAIGIKNKLPWNLSGDLKYFSKTTTGKTVVMGLNTYKSIISMIGKPLPNRKNVVLTLEKDPSIPDEQLTSIQEILDLGGKEDIFVIGGASVFAQTIPHADKLYITRVHGSPEADAFLKEIGMNEWKLISSDPHTKDEKNDYDYTFEIYERAR
ncbi:MAG: dihydrofolate reductase [Candidatus Paceibacterota bacterium]|jgi:dihydrofolate reductase